MFMLASSIEVTANIVLNIKMWILEVILLQYCSVSFKSLEIRREIRGILVRNVWKQREKNFIPVQREKIAHLKLFECIISRFVKWK